MKCILATKCDMTQFFDEAGVVYPATLLKAGPIIVTQVKETKKDGYTAVQVGFGKKRKITKPLRGHFSKVSGKTAGSTSRGFRYVKEFRVPEGAELKVGDVIDVSGFAEGDTVRVSGLAKGKGFAGVVKRHGFSGGPRSHGQKHSEREPGSIGATGPQRVFKGTRMAGRMGGGRVTVLNLTVLAVDKEKNELLVSGAVPGRRGSLVQVVGQ